VRECRLQGSGEGGECNNVCGFQVGGLFTCNRLTKSEESAIDDAAAQIEKEAAPRVKGARSTIRTREARKETEDAISDGGFFLRFPLSKKGGVTEGVPRLIEGSLERLGKLFFSNQTTDIGKGGSERL